MNAAREVLVGSAAHRHTPSEERRCREAALDATLAESFPASDPLSTLPNPDAHDVELDGDEAAAAVLPDKGLERA